MSVLDATKLQVKIIPETPNFGAVVEGVNTKEPLDDDVTAYLKAALLKYKVLFFRSQHLNRSQHVAFGKNFGDVYFNLSKYPNQYDDEGLANVSVITHFHADAMYRPDAPSYSILQMLEVPEVGGDTMWLDLVSSYNDLSETFRAFLETLTVVQGIRDFDLSDDELARDFRERRGKELTRDEIKELREELAPWEAPLVRVIPESGAKNYWVSDPVTKSIKGLSKQESDAILRVLFSHQMQPIYAYRWRWHAGDLAFWDQRTTLHRGMHDYGADRRHGNRVSIGPNTPIAVT